MGMILGDKEGYAARLLLLPVILPAAIALQVFYAVAGFEWREAGDWDVPIMRWWRPVEWDEKSRSYKTIWWRK